MALPSPARILIACLLGFLVMPASALAVKCGNDRCRTFDAASGGGGAMTSGPDGAVWFAGDGFVGRLAPGGDVKKVQIDTNPKHIGRRTAVDLGLVGDIKATVTALLPKVRDKTESRFLEKHLAETNSFHELLQHYVEKGPGIKPIRPEFLAATLSELASDDHRILVIDGDKVITPNDKSVLIAEVDAIGVHSRSPSKIGAGARLAGAGAETVSQAPAA